MSRYCHVLGLACLAVVGAVMPLSAQPAPLKELANVAPQAGTADALALAAKIDQLLARRQIAANVTPAPIADDAEFLRRVYLDVAGRIPSVSETLRLPGRQAS